MSEGHQNDRVNQQSNEGLPLRPGLEGAMRAEAAQILQDPQFLNSPTLARLLNWLVEETIAGRGDKIKSYTVAVEGLGRSNDFDSQADSYPRVQIGRLRKALETHYAQHGSTRDWCLYLQPGSYRIRTGQLEQAYPHLYRPLSGDALIQAKSEELVADDVGRMAMSPLSPFNLKAPKLPLLWIMIALATTLLLTVALQNLSDDGMAKKKILQSSNSPVVQLAPITGADGPQSASIANSAYALIADGLSRSWLTQVRTGPSGNSSSSGWLPATYNLETQLGDGHDGSKILFVRLNEIDSSTTVWSASQPIDAAKPIGDSVAPVISQMGGPYGAIARHQTRLAKDRFDPGYNCLLQYLSFLESLDRKQGRRVYECLQQPSPETRLEAVRYAFLASYSFDNEKAVAQPGAAVQNALKLSRRAIEINPKEAYAQFAMARTYFINDDCSSVRRYAQLAVSANPYDPIILAVAGNFNTFCGHDEGFDMLDKAYRYRVDGESFARLSLILAFIQSGDLDRLPTLKVARGNREGNRRAYYYLCETLIAVALGETEQGKENWKQFVAASPDSKNSPEMMLRHIILSNVARAKVIRYLSVNGII
ncbi:MAG: hypothetical protein ABI668_09950 [Sphingorhabdus sp.]